MADALSRISIEDAKPLKKIINENINDHANKHCRALTRQRTKLTEVSDNNRNEFWLREDQGFLIKPGRFDHIFSIISSKQINTLSKLIDVFETNLNEFNNSLKSLDDMRSLAILKIGINPDLNASLFHTIANLISQTINSNKLDDIAVNIDLGNEQNLFAFKWILREKFAGSKIKITIFLNKIIEITQIDHINQILRLYHESMLGGHCGIERMRQTIKRFYKWPTMNRDIINYVKKCLICEKTKVVKNTRAPLQITSVGSRPFEQWWNMLF